MSGSPLKEAIILSAYDRSGRKVSRESRQIRVSPIGKWWGDPAQAAPTRRRSRIAHRDLRLLVPWVATDNRQKTRSSQQRLEPLRERGVRERQLAVFEDGDLSEWSAQVAVVKYEDMGQLANSGGQVGHGARKSRFQFLARDVMPALRDTHGNAFFGQFRASNADEAQDHRVTSSLPLLSETRVCRPQDRKRRFRK